MTQEIMNGVKGLRLILESRIAMSRQVQNCSPANDNESSNSGPPTPQTAIKHVLSKKGRTTTPHSVCGIDYK